MLFVYQRQETGMVNAPREWLIEEYKNVDSQNHYKACAQRYNGNRVLLDQTLDYLQQTARDHARTPVQWDNTGHTGFSTATPSMRAHDNYAAVNVKRQEEDPKSLLAFWKKMLQLRKEHQDLFVYGHLNAYDFDNLSSFTSTREHGGRLALVSLNFSEAQLVVSPLGFPFKLNLLISSADQVRDGMLGLYQGRVYLVEPPLAN